MAEGELINMKDVLRKTVGRARRKLHLERLVKSWALFAGGFLVLSFLCSYLLVQQNFSDGTLFWARLIGGLGLVLLFLKYVFRPASRPPSRRQVARFLEERQPNLEDRLSTAVEMQEHPSRTHPKIRGLIEEDAHNSLKSIRQPRFYRPELSLFSFSVFLVLLLLFGYLFWGGPEVYRYSLNKLVFGWLDREQAPLYSIFVTPGNVTVGKHTDVEIRATLQGFDSQNVRLAAQYENGPHWEEALMPPEGGGNEFFFLFFDVRDRLNYYVKAEGIRSDTYTIQVSEIPRVENLKIILHFPPYSHLEPVTLENEGDIRALAGTKAEIQVQTDQPVQEGMIKLEEAVDVPLQMLGPQELRGTLQVGKDDYYRIHLQDSQSVWNPASDEYVIEALEDQPPIVSFSRPGRDQRVTNIEEVFTELRVEDDYGVAKTVLRFSVNGDPEQGLALHHPTGSRSFSTAHTFYLEEFDLQPGDFVSYYAKAFDAVASSTTDIYFLEVEPYDREFYQLQAASGTGSGAGRENVMLSSRQKEIIAATFNLQRDRQNLMTSEFDENNQTLALVQQRLQTEAQTIVGRIERRGVAAADPRFLKMVEHLKQAIDHMKPAHQHLSQSKPEAALPEEQKSLRQLLHVEALFKEIQVSFAQNQSGGGASSQDLADLVDLELDRTKNQYETLQQNRESNPEQALDEALEKLKELARRQEQNAERRSRLTAQATSGNRSSQDQLIEEIEQLARQLERLSRQPKDPHLSAISRQLRQAARNIRQSQSDGQDSGNAQMREERALECLQQARNALGRQRQNQITENLQKLKDDSRQLVQRQQEVIDKINQLEQQYRSGKVDQDFLRKLRRLLREKSEVLEEVHQLEGDLHSSARQTASKQAEASRKLKEAGLDIRDHRIPERMQEVSELLSRGWMDLARRREQGVGSDLEEVADKIESAGQSLRADDQSNPQEKLQRALNRIGDLVENLQSLKERVGPGSVVGPSRGVRPQQIRSEWQERMREAESIADLLNDHPDFGKDIAALAWEMRRLDSARLFTGTEEISRFRSQIIDGLHQLELEINRTLQQTRRNHLRLVNEDEVPAEFRELVEEYYRTLSTTRTP